MYNNNNEKITIFIVYNNQKKFTNCIKSKINNLMIISSL